MAKKKAAEDLTFHVCFINEICKCTHIPIGNGIENNKIKETEEQG